VAHTPGPWVAQIGMDARVFCSVDGRSINCGDVIYHPENADNARLVAAAPDLLAACKHAVECYQQSKNSDGFACAFNIDEIDAAIAKAEGR